MMNTAAEVDYKKKLEAFGLAYSGIKLSLGKSNSPSALVIAINGNLDSSNSDAFRKLVLEGLVLAKNEGGLILNLASLRYASSTGLGSFTAILLEARRHRIPFFLCHVQPSVRSVLDLLGFTSFFNCIQAFEASP